MKMEQERIGFSFKALIEILSGPSIKEIRQEAKSEKSVKKEVKRVQDEEERIGATDEIREQEFSSSLSRTGYVNKIAHKAMQKEPKLKSKRDKEKSSSKEKEIE